MKDDSGAYAVFAEHDSSASQMTVAKVKDVITRLSDCDGQVDDVISAYTQEKLTRILNKYSTFQKSESPDVWTRLPKH